MPRPGTAGLSGFRAGEGVGDRKTDRDAGRPTAGEARKIAALLQKIAGTRAQISRRTLADAAEFLRRCADRLEAVESLSGGERPPDEPL